MDDVPFTVEVTNLVPQEHVQRQADEHIVDMPVPQFLEEIDEGDEVGPRRTRATTDR